MTSEELQMVEDQVRFSCEQILKSVGLGYLGRDIAYDVSLALKKLKEKDDGPKRNADTNLGDVGRGTNSEDSRDQKIPQGQPNLQGKEKIHYPKGKDKESSK